MAKLYPERVSFIAEWYQDEAAISRTYTMFYYTRDNAIEIYNRQNKKTFLRRTKMPELTERDFFVGSKINVFGRQFDIVDYGDEITKTTLFKHRKRTFILLKNSITHHLGMVLSALIDSNFDINKGLMVDFTAKQANEFLNESNKGDTEKSVLLSQLLAGPAIGFEVNSDDAVEKIKNCLRHEATKPHTADMPIALRQLCEREDMRSGIYCSQNDEEVKRDTTFFFDNNRALQKIVQLKNTIACIIKPHAIKEGNLGKIISDITSNGFTITALRMQILEKVNCSEFYETYKEVLPEYSSMVSHLASGVSMALEIACVDASKNCYMEFRNFCGPMDPKMSKHLRANTLRAKYGKDKVLNAVHCTDLPDSTVLEIQYLFTYW